VGYNLSYLLLYHLALSSWLSYRLTSGLLCLMLSLCCHVEPIYGTVIWHCLWVVIRIVKWIVFSILTFLPYEPLAILTLPFIINCKRLAQCTQ
jgi:hypothetical protein